MQREIAELIGRRLAGQAADYETILIEAAPEFCTWAVAEAMMRCLHGDAMTVVRPPVSHGDVAAWKARVEEGLLSLDAAGGPLLILLTSEDVAEHRVLGPIVGQTFAQRTPSTRLVVAVATDDFDDDPRRRWFQAHFDYVDLTLSMADIGQLAGVMDDGERATIRWASGGVPALVAVPGDTNASPLFQAAQRAEAWAERLYPRIKDDPILCLHCWAGAISDEAIAHLVTEMSERPCAVEQVRRARAAEFIGRTPAGVAVMPEGLALALRRLMMQRDPARSRHFQESLAAKTLASPHLRAMEQLQVLSALRAWGGMDEVLSQRSYVLAATWRALRPTLIVALPEQVPSRYRSLHRAWRYVTHGAPATEAWLPTPWRDLDWLLRDQVSRRNVLPQELALQLRKVLAACGLDMTRARHATLLFVNWLRSRLADWSGVSGVAHDEAALLILAALGAADACLVEGEIIAGQQCLRAALRLLDQVDPEGGEYPALWPSLYGRAAFLAAKGGMHYQALERLAAYEGWLARSGPVDADAERLVELARAMVVGTSAAEARPRPVDPDQPFAPFHAEIEGMRAAVLLNPEAALAWLRGLGGRVVWSSHSDAEWWPLFGLLALLEARQGWVGAAEEWLERTSLPEPYGLVVRASILLAQGALSEAASLANQVLAHPRVTLRWRLLATGIKFSSSEPDVQSCWEPTIASEVWDEMLGVVVLLPDAARARILPNLLPQHASLPGFAMVAEAAASGPSVKLTRRQVQVLRGLSRHQTMQEIADELFVGVETVRSTAKASYRRLGVHDRDAAVQKALALGLLASAGG